MRNAGIPIQSQTVLLKNVNDDLSTLENLFNSLVELGIKPGYLFQCDLAKGTSHFRVPLDEACDLYAKLKDELSGLSLPKFAVDIPGGGGKFNLENLIKSINELKEKIGIKKSIKEYGIDEKDFMDRLDEMSEQAFDDQCTGANPRYPLMQEIKDMYIKAYYGGER